MLDINIDTLRQIAPLVTSWAALARTFDLISDRRLKRLCKEHSISISHFVGNKRALGTVRVGKNVMSLTEYLAQRKSRNGDALRRRLIAEGLKTEACECCSQTTWQGKYIPLEMHHVDGDRLNNVATNLQILCCNCHALTSNYKGLNSKRRKTRITTQQYQEAIEGSDSLMEACRKLGISPQGGNLVTLKRVSQKYSFALKRPQDQPVPESLLSARWQEIPTPPLQPIICKQRVVSKCPPVEELARLVWEMPFSYVGKKFGVTGGAVKRWCTTWAVTVPPIGYWVRRVAGYSHEESLVTQRRIKSPLRRPTKEQTDIAYAVWQRTNVMRRAAKAIGFDHEVTRDAMIRFGLLPEGYRCATNKIGRPKNITEEARIELSTGDQPEPT